jgi:hypothetical protein
LIPSAQWKSATKRSYHQRQWYDSAKETQFSSLET